jgi:type IV pilus assembly protein PilN
MKFKINLATQPYEDARRFFALWGTALVLLAVVTGGLIYAAVQGWRHTHVISQKINAERVNLDKLNRQEQQDLAILNKTENRDVRDKSRVLNSLIRRKEFSWTLIFADMEHIMPARLHVLSIAPHLDVNNDIQVRMIVAGDSREKAIELVANMEKSREFRHSQVLAETDIPRDQAGTQAGDLVQFEISAEYVPGAFAIPPAEQKAGEQKGGQ